MWLVPTHKYIGISIGIDITIYIPQHSYTRYLTTLRLIDSVVHIRYFQKIFMSIFLIKQRTIGFLAQFLKNLEFHL